MAKQRVFKITIHLSDGSTSIRTIAAKDDQDAITRAIYIDNRAYEKQGLEMPEVDFCETSWITDLDK